MLIKGPVTTPYTIVPHSVRLTFLQVKNDGLLTVLISRASDGLVLFVFPREYICTFLIVWKSDQLQFPSYFNNRNTSFLMKFKPFPELTNILLPEHCETSGEISAKPPTLNFAEWIWMAEWRNILQRRMPCCMKQKSHKNGMAMKWENYFN